MLIALIFFPMAAGLLLPLIGLGGKRLRNICMSAVTAIELGLSVWLLLQGADGVLLRGIAGMGIALEADGFRRVYAVVIAFVWCMTTLFGCEYLAHSSHTNRYCCLNLITLGALMGVFLSADLFTALLFFEIMSFTSYPWVLHEETPEAIRAANTYLAVAVIGGLVALMGLFLLQHTLGTTTISDLYEAAAASDQKAVLYVAGGCVLFGFGAKAGMFPLHIWLPKAHPVAPAPASALLSGLLTKSGVFGVLAISSELFRNDPAWGTAILILGAITMLLGAVLALFSVDLKRTLACSSVSQIGFILVGIGTMGLLGTDGALAARGTLLHMLNHSLFKLVLFMAAGVVFMNLHRLHLNDIRGFGRKKPLLLIPFLLGALGIGGFPLMSGYVSKTLLHEGIVEAIGVYGTGWLNVLEWTFLVSGGLTVAYMTKLTVALFFEKHPTRQAEFDAIKRCMNPVSAIALCASAALIPLLGLTATHSMDAIATLGTDFFHGDALQHAVQYLSWENLKGALLSIAIGAALYGLVVRPLLMKRENGVRVYRNLWPKWLDLEELLYRPLLTVWLPGILHPIARLFGENRVLRPLLRKGFSGVLQPIAELLGENRILTPVSKAILSGAKIGSHALSDSLDALVLLLRKTAYRDLAPAPDDDVQGSVAYRIGKRVDRIAVRHGREQTGELRYAQLNYRVHRTLRTTSRRITGNLSFALLMLVLAVSAVFLYVLILR